MMQTDFSSRWPQSDRIAEALFGCPWQGLVTVLDTVDSTNTFCKRLVLQGAPEGTTVIARQQTAGRGRLGRSFSSMEGGLYMSIILRPDGTPDTFLHLTAMAAVAAMRAIQDATGVQPKIKWTNDLVLGGRKLAGILTELSANAVILGIGVNCCHQRFEGGLSQIAVSLEDVLGQCPDTSLLAAGMIRRFYDLRQCLFEKKTDWLKSFSENCITLGQDVRLIRDDTVTSAHALSIDDQAGLVVRLADGSVQTVSCGEVSVRGLYGYTDGKEYSK